MDARPTRTHCPYCSLQRGITLTLAGSRVRLEAQDEFPTNRGGLCSKGWTAAELLDHPDRLVQPLVRDRRDAPLRSTSWDDALDRVAQAIRRSQQRYGADSVGCFGGGGLTNEKAYQLGKFGQYIDEPDARFINDRVHANIQRDGTFWVVPQVLGGVTTPAQLRRIADVAERYQIPMLKITAGQRIDLLSVRKEDLPRVWADLDMPSGAAGAHVRKGDLLATVERRDEAITLTGRFLQYYRENAKWLERSYEFVPRIGLAELQAILVEDRDGIAARLDQAIQQSIDAYRDPWHEHQQPVTEGQFRDALPLVELPKVPVR